MQRSDSPTPNILRVAGLNTAAPTQLRLAPDAAARAALARDLGIDALRKLRLDGTIRPEGARDWVLEARLGATVVQPCVVTLAPVTTRIEQAVTRRFLADPPEMPDAAEAEMPEDDTIEALGDTIDLGRILAEALALALPDYPRADGAEPVAAVFTEPGKKPMTDDDAKPFAGLAAMRNKLTRDGD